MPSHSSTNSSTDYSDSFSTKTANLVEKPVPKHHFSTKTIILMEKPDKKAGRFQRNRPACSLYKGHYQMTTLSSSGRNISPSVMPKAS